MIAYSLHGCPCVKILERAVRQGFDGHEGKVEKPSAEVAPLRYDFMIGGVDREGRLLFPNLDRVRSTVLMYRAPLDTGNPNVRLLASDKNGALLETLQTVHQSCALSTPSSGVGSHPS